MPEITISPASATSAYQAEQKKAAAKIAKKKRPQKRPKKRARPSKAGDRQRQRATNLRSEAKRERGRDPARAAELDDQAAKLDALAQKLDELTEAARAQQQATPGEAPAAASELQRVTELAELDPIAAADELGIDLETEGDETEGEDVDGGETLPWLPGADETSPQFRRGVVELARRVGIPPDEVWGVIGLESKFNPAAQNTPAEGRATGLIQWMPKWAPRPIEELVTLTREQQLPFVEAFFRRSGTWRQPGDAYIMTFWPAALGKPDEHVIARQGEIDPVLKADVYKANRGLDTNGDGQITAGDVRQKLIRAISGAKRIDVDAGPAAPEAPIVAAEARASSMGSRLVKLGWAVLAGGAGGALLWLARRRGR